MTNRLWDPLVRVPPNPGYMRMIEAHEDLRNKRIEVWANSFYQVTARIYTDGFTHLSCKRDDRLPVHDWRQLQEIKNTICGSDRWAVEIYPAETDIVDTSNEYHLWVLPEGNDIPWAFHERQLMTPDEITAFNESHVMIDRFGDMTGGKARQRPWQPGLSTGLGDSGTVALVRELLEDAELVDDPDTYYGYLVSPSLIKKLKEVVNDVGT